MESCSDISDLSKAIETYVNKYKIVKDINEFRLKRSQFSDENTFTIFNRWIDLRIKERDK